MGRFVIGALLLVACGKVAEVPADATSDALPDAFACAAAKQQCGATCTDLMSDMANCGACGAACGSGTTCAAGNCTDTLSSCAEIHANDPSTPSGSFTDPANNHFFYCDMAAGPMQYEALGIGEFDVAYGGWTLATPTDLQDPALQGAFIDLFNHQGGAQLIATFTPTNCCFKFDASTNVLELNAEYLEPGHVAGLNQCGGALADPLYSFTLMTGPTSETLPLPDTFFTTNPPSAAVNCSPGANPAFFWERHL